MHIYLCIIVLTEVWLPSLIILLWVYVFDAPVFTTFFLWLSIKRVIKCIWGGDLMNHLCIECYMDGVGYKLRLTSFGSDKCIGKENQIFIYTICRYMYIYVDIYINILFTYLLWTAYNCIPSHDLIIVK